MKQVLLFAISLFLLTKLQAQNVGIGTTNPTAQLHTTGSVRFQGLAGDGNRLVSIDADGNLMTSLTGSRNDSTAVMNIQPCSTSFIRYISISGLPVSIVSANFSVEVSISVDQPSYNVGKFGMLLEAPNGNRLVLFSTAEANGRRIQDAVFTDAGSNFLYFSTTPYTNYYKPDGGDFSWCTQFPANVSSFSAIGGGAINPNGIWKLIVEADPNYGPEPGMFHSWAINFSPVSIQNGIDNYIPKWENGNLTGTSAIVDKNGKVGIGTDSPIKNLQVTGGGDVEMGLQNIDGNGRFWTLQSNPSAPGLNTTFQIVDRTAESSRLGIDSMGNVGIGTVQPLQKLHVEGSMYISNKLGIGIDTPVTALSLRTNASYAADFLSTAPVTKILVSNGNKFNAWGVDGTYSYIDRESTIPFSIQCDGVDQFYVLSNGNIGIGTTSPTDKLHVNGTTRFVGNSTTTGDQMVTGNLGLGVTTPLKRIQISGSGDQEINMLSTDSGSHSWSLQANGSSPVSTFQIIDRTVNQSRIGIDNSGNVGIGTNTPSATLDVNGSIRTAYSGSVVINLSTGVQTVNLTINSLPAGWTFSNTALVVTNVDGVEGIIRQAKITSQTNIQLKYEALGGGAVRFNYVVFKL